MTAAAVPTPRPRPDRARASAEITQRAVQQIQDALTGDIDAAEFAAILRELHDETDPQGGVLGAVAQLFTVAARAAERIEPDRDGDASCPLHEAASLLTDNVGQRLIWAVHSLDPQGDPA